MMEFCIALNRGVCSPLSSVSKCIVVIRMRSIVFLPISRSQEGRCVLDPQSVVRLVLDVRIDYIKFKLMGSPHTHTHTHIPLCDCMSNYCLSSG